MSYDDCTEISALCPVEATVLGYYPNLGSSIFFAIGFGLCFIAALGLGIWKRTWTYCVAICIGLLLETLGYVGRALLHKNPWDSGAFQLQICATILAPTFVCAGLYLTLKHVALALSISLSRLRPRFYPIIFLPADLACLIVQAIGGGIAAAAGKTDLKLLKGGNNAIIAGVALQVAVLLVFGALAVDYYLRVRKVMASSEADPAALAVWRDTKFRQFGYAVTGAYLALLTRCIYRIAEMAGGWGNHIMQDQPSFLVLDSSLVLVSCYLLTVFHPGLFFPQMANARRVKKSKKSKKGEEAVGEAALEAGESSGEGHKTEQSSGSV